MFALCCFPFVFTAVWIKMADVVHMIDSEVFLAFSTYATIVVLKMMLMSFMTSYFRLTKQVGYLLCSIYCLCNLHSIFSVFFLMGDQTLIFSNWTAPLLGFFKPGGHHLGEDHRGQEEAGQGWSGCGKSATVTYKWFYLSNEGTTEIVSLSDAFALESQVPSEWPGKHCSLCGDRSSVCTHGARSLHGSVALPGVCRVTFHPHSGLCDGSAPAYQRSGLWCGAVHNFFYGLPGAHHSTFSLMDSIHFI